MRVCSFDGNEPRVRIVWVWIRLGIGIALTRNNEKARPVQFYGIPQEGTKICNIKAVRAVQFYVIRVVSLDIEKGAPPQTGL